MKKLMIAGIAGLLAFAYVSSCTKENVVDYAGLQNCEDTISFSQQIEPMIQTNCATSGCHDATTAESGYNFTSHDAISSNASIILSAIRHDAGTAPMPDNADKLADSIIQQFSCWVYQGKKNN